MKKKKESAPLPDHGEMIAYLTEGGWIQSWPSGWWHPPSCLAAWPLAQAFKMAKDDEAKGLRMTPND